MTNLEEIMESIHWADKIADELTKLNPHKKVFICAAGVSPSGTVHIGNFRDLITSDIVVRSLKDKGYNAKLVFFWDDYDRFRKVPKGIPETYSQYIGMPLVEVPDPYKCHASYAKHFEEELEKVIPELGIDVEFISQAGLYKKNVFYEYIKKALQKRKEIGEILSDFKSQEVSKEEIKNYFPIKVYCKQCKKDDTTITNYDEKNNLSYSCKCGSNEEVDISKENIGKLVWKVDWPMRWSFNNINFEPGGEDHATPGGSYDIAKEIARKIFGIEPPTFQAYAFVSIRGLGYKMSGSAGGVVSPNELLEIYEPGIIRWFFARISPMKAISFAFDSELIRQYDEFDKEVLLHFNKKLNNNDERALYLSRPNPKKDFDLKNVSFRQVASFGQIAQGSLNELKNIFERIGQSFNDYTLKQRLNRAETWIKKYAPQFEIKVRDIPNESYYKQLGVEEKNQVKRLKLEMDSNWNLNDLTILVYSIPKKQGMSENEKKEKQREFFKNIYQLMIDTDTGPRLPTFLLALGKEKAKRLLQFKEESSQLQENKY